MSDETKKVKKPRATKKKTIKVDPSQVVPDKDNPALAEVGGVIHLRVFEDFFAEQELPRYKTLADRRKALKKLLGVDYTDSMQREIDKYKKLKKQAETDEKIFANADAKTKEICDKLDVLEREFKECQELAKIIDDDRWHIQNKHEREVREKLAAQVVIVAKPKLKDRIKNFFKRGKKVELKPVEIAFEDLKQTIEIATTDELARTLATLQKIEAGMRVAGQYVKADRIKEFSGLVAAEKVLVDKGFEKFITEEQMIKFIRTSERGVMVDFLRYYDGIIPEDVIAKKVAADQLMIFDNYVVAYYSNAVKAAEKASAEQKVAVAKEQRAKRRDPILFGVIKSSRKLFYIADWTTDTDDLTLDVLEKALGETAKILSDPTSQIEVSADGRHTNLNEIHTALNTYSNTDADRYWTVYDQASEDRMILRRIINANMTDGGTRAFDDGEIVYNLSSSNSSGGSTR